MPRSLPAAPVRDAETFQHIVRLERVDMTFGRVQALSQVDFAVGRNEIVGLIGDNGAGKSTLIKIISGVLRPTAGTVWIRDKRVDPSSYSVRRAHDLRIETVHQAQSLGEKQPLWRHAIGFRGQGITADSTVHDLSGGERQGIAIARAMHFQADLIVLDEPTTALAVNEVRKVLGFIEHAKSGGRACIYIEHTLAHVHEVADRLVILDRGKVVREIQKGELSLAELTRQMIA